MTNLTPVHEIAQRISLKAQESSKRTSEGLLLEERPPKAKPMAEGRWPDVKFNLDSPAWMTPRGVPFDVYRHPDLEYIAYKVLLWARNCRQTGMAIALMGGTGAGKSALANLIYSNVFTPMKSRFIDEPTLFGDLKDSFEHGLTSRKIIRLNREPVLFLDDIGTLATRSPDWVHEVYWRIFDGRFEAKRPTFVTTNLTMAEFCKWVGYKAWSRLEDAFLSDEFIIDMFGIPDYRASKLYDRSIDSLIDDGILA